MKMTEALDARLVFLARIVGKECQYLQDTDQRLFNPQLEVAQLVHLSEEPLLAERLDAFVSRFGRLQDTVGDKLLPALLSALAETVGPAMDNLDKAEKFGFIASSDAWMEMRRLRNQMVHEYIEDLSILSNALNLAHAFVPELLAAAARCVQEVERIRANRAA